ncbi:MAG: hypothetical protein ACJ786_34970 [Catenulispora sp.]
MVGSALLSAFILISAFLIASSWSTYNSDRQHTYDEARSTTVAYWLAGRLPSTEVAQVRDGLTGYVNMVITDEWPLMAHHDISTAAWTDLDRLRSSVAALHPADAAAEKRRSDLAAALDDVYMKRAVRAGDVNYAVPKLIYAALIAAALLLIAYPPLVGFTANARNVALLAGFGAMIGVGIYVVIELSRPYSPPLTIHPTAFKFALERFAQITGQASG